MSVPSAKTAAMVNQRKKESLTKRQTVQAVIEAMERTRTPITVGEVARRAHVSPWLVRQEPLMQELRNAQRRTADNEPRPATERGHGSLRVERDLLRQENQKLRREIGSYRQRISVLLGEQLDGTDQRTQNLRIQELTSQNEALTRQASEALQELQQLGRRLREQAGELEAAHTVNRSLMT